MVIWKWLNEKRLRDYPRLILFASGSVVLLNVVLSHGWIGGLTGILMWGDFIDYVAAGIIYKTDITQLYNPVIQEISQLRLITPTIPPGVTFYSYPPNAALFHSVLSTLPLPILIILWCILSLCCAVLAAKLIRNFLVPDWLAREGLSSTQLSIIILSSFAFIEGFAAGQMHSITLLLMVGLLVATIKEKWFLAGLLAASLTYKPQFVIGFLLIWLLWKKYVAILVFILFSLIWHGSVLITKGINPYLTYVDFLKNMLYLPNIKEGFPNSILATTYSVIASMVPIKYAMLWNQIYYVFIVIITVIFAWLAFKVRKLTLSKQNVVLSIAMLFPLLITPYSLLHDLLLLFPVLILLNTYNRYDRRILLLSVGVYIAMVLLPILSFTTKIALTGLLPTVVLIYAARQAYLLIKT